MSLSSSTHSSTPNDRLASLMDSIYAIVAGLGLRLVVDTVSRHDFKITGTLIGLWEGVILLHFLKKLPKSTDPYLAFAVRLFIDFLVTESVSRLVLVLTWTAMGIILADVAPAIWEDLGLRRVWRRFRRDLYVISESVPTVVFFPPTRTVRFSPSREPSVIAEEEEGGAGADTHTEARSVVSSSSAGGATEQDTSAIIDPTSIRRRLPGYFPGMLSDTESVLSSVIGRSIRLPSTFRRDSERTSRRLSVYPVHDFASETSSQRNEVEDDIKLSSSSSSQSTVTGEPADTTRFTDDLRDFDTTQLTDIPDEEVVEEQKPVETTEITEAAVKKDHPPEPVTIPKQPNVPFLLPPTPSDSQPPHRRRRLPKDDLPLATSIPQIPDLPEDVLSDGPSDGWEKIQREDFNDPELPWEQVQKEDAVDSDKPPPLPPKDWLETNPPLTTLTNTNDLAETATDEQQPQRRSLPPPYDYLDNHDDIYEDHPSNANPLGSVPQDSSTPGLVDLGQQVDETAVNKQREENEKRIEQEAAEKKLQEEEKERKRVEEEERKRKEEEEVERKRKEEEEEVERKRVEEEAEEKRRAVEEAEERWRKEEEEAERRRKEEEEAERKRKEEEAVKRRRMENEAERRRMEEEAERRRTEEEEAKEKRRWEEEAEEKRRWEEEAEEKRRAEEEAVKRWRMEQEAERRRMEEEAEEKRRREEEAEEKRRAEEEAVERKRKEEEAAEKERIKLADEAAAAEMRRQEEEAEIRRLDAAEQKRKEDAAAAEKPRQEEVAQKSLREEAEQKRLEDEAEQQRLEEEKKGVDVTEQRQLEEKEKRRLEGEAETHHSQQAGTTPTPLTSAPPETQEVDRQQNSETVEEEAQVDEEIGDNEPDAEDQHRMENESVATEQSTVPTDVESRLRRILITKAQIVELRSRIDELETQLANADDERKGPIESDLQRTQNVLVKMKNKEQRRRDNVVPRRIQAGLNDNEDHISFDTLNERDSKTRLVEELEELLSPDATSLYLTLDYAKQRNSRKNQKKAATQVFVDFCLVGHSTWTDHGTSIIKVPDEVFSEWVTEYRRSITQLVDTSE